MTRTMTQVEQLENEIDHQKRMMDAYEWHRRVMEEYQGRLERVLTQVRDAEGPFAGAAADALRSRP
ncbi:MAG: hypothetical protein LCH88_05370 [Proteobacteria bacterium]|nr:hypothetical protein [Pseudomonadota bacterium]